MMKADGDSCRAAIAYTPTSLEPRGFRLKSGSGFLASSVDNQIDHRIKLRFPADKETKHFCHAQKNEVMAAPNSLSFLDSINEK
jgi:hypothetical protein